MVSIASNDKRRLCLHKLRKSSHNLIAGAMHLLSVIGRTHRKPFLIHENTWGEAHGSPVLDYQIDILFRCPIAMVKYIDAFFCTVP